MSTKTYGVEGLADWQCSIPVGRAKVSIHFAGGAMTRYGVTPAEYTTSDPFTQRVIEGSDYFKQGRIVLLRQHGGEGKREKVKSGAVAPQEEKLQAAGELKEVEVACLTEAADYLRDNFGIPTSRVRSREKALTIGRENGVYFKGLD